MLNDRHTTQLLLLSACRCLPGPAAMTPTPLCTVAPWYFDSAFPGWGFWVQKFSHFWSVFLLVCGPSSSPVASRGTQWRHLSPQPCPPLAHHPGRVHLARTLSTPSREVGAAQCCISPRDPLSGHPQGESPHYGLCGVRRASVGGTGVEEKRREQPPRGRAHTPPEGPELPVSPELALPPACSPPFSASLACRLNSWLPEHAGA